MKFFLNVSNLINIFLLRPIGGPRPNLVHRAPRGVSAALLTKRLVSRGSDRCTKA